MGWALGFQPASNPCGLNAKGAGPMGLALFSFQKHCFYLRTLRHRRVFILAVLQEKHREPARIFYPSVKSRVIR
jgi:hypothetical protein